MSDHHDDPITEYEDRAGREMVWAKSTELTGVQIKTMYSEVLQRSLVMAVEQAEAEARRLGVDESRVRVMFLTEFPYIEHADEAVQRVDKYTITVDGAPIRATPDQEAAVRAMTPEQRDRFLRIMGRTP